jgi:hypothetical protein
MRSFMSKALGPLRRTAGLLWTIFLGALVCLAGTGFQSTYGPQMTLQRRTDKPAAPDKAPDIVSKAQLNPPLRSRLRELRFSPNGAYILLQDEGSTYVIQTNPIRLVFSVLSGQALPVRFSADSKSIVSASPEMEVSRYSVSDGKEIDRRILGGGGECFAATLSIDGELYACLDGRSELKVFRTRTGVQIFSQRRGEPPAEFGFMAPYHVGLARSEPFGFYRTDAAVARDLMVTTRMLALSPDGRYLAGRGLYANTATLVDLQNRKEISIAKPIRKALDENSLLFVAPDRVVAIDSTKESEAALLSFPSGATIQKLGTRGTITATSNPRYVTDLPDGAHEANLIDLQTGKSVGTIGERGSDVWGSEILSYTDDGMLTFTEIGEQQPDLAARVPVSPLPLLRAAAVSPDLSTIVLGIAGQAGIFQTATGKRVEVFDSLRGAWFPDDRTCYIRVPGAQLTSSTIEKIDVQRGTISSVAPLNNVGIRNESISSGPVLLANSAFMGLASSDSTSGKALWSRLFGREMYEFNPQQDMPVAFTDPQGDRVVLGWMARSSGGKQAADRDPGEKQLLKTKKISEYDSLFEVLDARTGKTLGEALVQTGAAPGSFDSAFSEGDWLVLEKDERRVMVISLSTGEQILEEPGYVPAISAQAALLAVTADAGHLTLYDLNARNQKSRYEFPQQIAYMHFSAHGKRLLVVTEDQEVYILDLVSGAASPTHP